MTDTDYTSDEPSTPENGFAVISPYRPLTRTAHNDLKDYGIIDTIDNTDQMNRGNGVRVETQPPIDLLEKHELELDHPPAVVYESERGEQTFIFLIPELVTSHGVETTYTPAEAVSMLEDRDDWTVTEGNPESVLDRD
jgi:hypothetical protein